MLAWLLGAGLGPAAVAVPVNWAADALAGAAQRWFKRLRRTDDLSRLVRAATGTSVDLTQAEFDVVRKLLEDQQTWSVAGRGTVEDLATRIADCLPPRDGRTAGDSHAAALTIARGLLEFAVADLDPKLFQQVLMARLQRMQTGQASTLDQALLGLHARFDSVMEQLKLVLDRLPRGPAGRGEIAVYLRTLIDWLNTDPWPRDPQFRGPVLTPAAIERKLRITATGRVREQDLDADGLAQQCTRLVILGGPGAGKTWLAKRTARRCAENALQVLAAGGTLKEVELPLYTTCSRLFSAGGDIREAVVSSALDQLADLGGSRISAALGVFFAERNAPTLLIIDSLDEAHGPSERLRQAGTLPWRIVLTSRPSSWRNQLAVSDTDESSRVGELQPLSYPGDVEPFIERWFAGRQERGNDLAAQIARRPGLQQAATVPLILAFYCIVGGTGPLPGFRRDLYTRVLNRMLTGRWRGDDDRQPDAGTCLQTLRAWAWDGAASNHPVSGVGTWTDDIPAKRVRLGEADADALDHVATPLGPADVDTGTTLRRFIHRSVREHVVAEHVASLPVDDAVKVLLPHLWYDPDWEYAAPAALAMHSQHDQLLRELICRAARSERLPGDLSVIDAGWESRGLLARVAAESREADWSPEVARMIGQARVELARSGRFDDLGGAGPWGTSDRQVREVLLGLLAREVYPGPAARLARALARLDPAAEDKRQACEVLLGLLARAFSRYPILLADALAGLDPAAEDKRQACEVLLGLLARQADPSTAGPRPGTPAAAAKALARLDPADRAAPLADALARLDPAAEDKRQACEVLLGLLAGETGGWVAGASARALARLATTAEDKRQAREVLLGLLARQANPSAAARLADALAGLDPAAEDKRQACEVLLGLLAGEPGGWAVARMADALAGLDPAAEDKRQARGVLLGLLAGEPGGWAVARMADALARLDPAAEDKRQARDAVVVLLAGETEADRAIELADALAGLDPAAEDKRQARGVLLGLLAGEPGWWAIFERLTDALARLTTTAEDKRQARGVLLGLLASETGGRAVARMADVLARLDPAAEDKRQARDAVVVLLAGENGADRAIELADALAGLDPAAEDKRQARDAVVVLLAGENGARPAIELADVLAGLDPAAEDKRQAREVLLGLLASENGADRAIELADVLARLATTAEDKRQAREVLLGLLASENGWAATRLADALARLDPAAEDKRQARGVLLGLLAGQTDDRVAAELAAALAQLDPTVHDLRTWRAWAVRPTAELLAAVRRNSALTDWLEALPLLTSLPGSPA